MQIKYVNFIYWIKWNTLIKVSERLETELINVFVYSINWQLFWNKENLEKWQLFKEGILLVPPLLLIPFAILKSIHRLVANALDMLFSKGDAIAIDMPMTATAVIIYLAIVLAGFVVVSIADSFAPKEISTRLRVSKAKGIFTQVLTLFHLVWLASENLAMELERMATGWNLLNKFSVSIWS